MRATTRSPTVLHVIEAFGGGIERHLLDLVRHVGGFSHVLAIPSVHLGQSTAESAQRAREAGAEIVTVEIPRSVSPVANVRAFAALRRLIRSLRPAIVHGHSSIGGGMARLAASGVGPPVVYTPNGIARGRAALAAERLLSRRTDCLIAVSETEAAFLSESGVMEPGRTVVVPNGIEVEPPPPLRPALRDRLGVPADAPFVGSLGRLTRQKAPEVFVEACAIVRSRVPSAHFLLIGAGPLEREVAEMVRRVGLNGCMHRMAGLPDAAAAFGEFDVFALSSRFEGGPYTLLEAMRAGIPVVATKAAGNADAVEDGVTGRLVEVDDSEGLADAIAGLLADGQERRRFGAAGRERLRRRFEVLEMARRTEAVYREVANVGTET